MRVKPRLSIPLKIWLSIGILIFSYFITMMFGFILGQRAETRLNNVSNFLFPASKKSQLALTAFKDQVKLYEEAILLGEVSFIDSANKRASQVREALMQIMALDGLGDRDRDQIKLLLKDLSHFTQSAHQVYTIMSANWEGFSHTNAEGVSNIDIALSQKAFRLAQQSASLSRALETFSKTFSNRLKAELASINKSTRRHRYLSMVLFFVVVVVAITLIAIIINRSITKPLKKTYMLENAVEQSIDGIVVTDLGGELQFVNHAWAAMHGYGQTDLIQQHVKIFHSVGQWDQEVLPFKKEVENRGAYTAEVGHKRRDGSVFPTMMTMNLLCDRNNLPVGLVAVARDITDQKRNEAELQNAKIAAETANIAKSEFLANMSHEVRTPMSGVIGMSNLLLDTELSMEQRDYVETIQYSADSLLSIINDILDFSKIEAGKMELEVIKFDIRGTIEEVVDLLAMKAYEKGLELVSTIHEDVPAYLKGDPGRLRQIMVNLAGNAIKFTHQGEVIIRISLVQETESEAVIRISVSDSGIGIAKNKLDTLFHSFTQVDASTTRKYGGTGLGLAISKKLVKLMGGGIGVESNEGNGSTFWFTAVFEKQSQAYDDLKVMPDAIRNKHVLVVDDNIINQEIICQYLKSWHCFYDSASNAREALVLLRQAVDNQMPFHLAIVDFMMPEIGGDELGCKIKADPLIKETILVMLTSRGLRGDAAHVREIGFAAYLTKPIRRNQMYECLYSLLSQTRESTSGEQPCKLITRYSLSTNEGRSLKVLLAEDNLVNRKLALRLLEKFGCSADAVNDGLDVLKALAKSAYDIVLMDVQMPNMDGLEATAIIRDQQSRVLNHEIPIVAMTAYAMKGDRERCLNAGMNDYLSKPIEPAKLLETLEKYM